MYTYQNWLNLAVLWQEIQKGIPLTNRVYRFTQIWISIRCSSRIIHGLFAHALSRKSQIIYVSNICVNRLRPKRNGHHFTDEFFKCIFFNKNVWISIKLSPKFVPKRPICNIAALVQIMAWYRPGNKPLSETTMVSLPTHICITQPQFYQGPR